MDKLIALGPHKEISFNQQLHNKWCHCQIKIGLDYWCDGNFDDSIKHMQQVIDKDLTFGAVPYYYIGVYHWFHHRNFKAIYYIEKASVLKPMVENYKQHLITIINEVNNKYKYETNTKLYH